MVRRFWTLWTGVVLLALVWMLLDTPAAPIPAVAPASADAALPALPLPSDSASELALLSGSLLWGPRTARPAGNAASAEAAQPEPAWLLSGTYAAAGQRVLVVHFEGLARPSQQLRVGDRLPDGTTLRAIEAHRVLVQPRGDAQQRRPAPRWLPVNRTAPVPDN